MGPWIIEHWMTWLQLTTFNTDQNFLAEFCIFHTELMLVAEKNCWVGQDVACLACSIEILTLCLCVRRVVWQCLTWILLGTRCYPFELGIVAGFTLGNLMTYGSGWEPCKFAHRISKHATGCSYWFHTPKTRFQLFAASPTNAEVVLSRHPRGQRVISETNL
jgi:hypothetical protein